MAQFKKKNSKMKEEDEEFERLLEGILEDFDGEIIESGDKEQGADEIMATIGLQKGWGTFKARMEEMVTRCQVGSIREEVGFDRNLPRLHTALIGNPGTGKTKAVQLMARLYKSLGLLDTDYIWTTRVSTLVSSGIGVENEAVAKAVENAQGGILVIDLSLIHI